MPRMADSFYWRQHKVITSYCEPCNRENDCDCENQTLRSQIRSWNYGLKRIAEGEIAFRLNRCIVKLAFYTQTSCIVILGILIKDADFQSYAERPIVLEKGLSVMCLCKEFSTSTKFYVKKRTIERLHDPFIAPMEKVHPVCTVRLRPRSKEQEICNFTIFPSNEPPTLKFVCEAELALQFRSKYYWE